MPSIRPKLCYSYCNIDIKIDHISYDKAARAQGIKKPSGGTGRPPPACLRVRVRTVVRYTRASGYSIPHLPQHFKVIPRLGMVGVKL
jgi:hypothetical protein